MRGLVIILSTFVLAACDSGTVPSPSERMNDRADPAAPVIADNAVELRAEGLAAGSEAFFFSAGRSEVEGALTASLGEPEGRTIGEECGAGRMEFTSFPGALTVNFQDGFMVGWVLGEQEGGANIALQSGLKPGAPRSEVEGTTGYAPITDSTLGEEFALGGKIGGFLEEDRLTMLYAGTQCFFR